MSEPIMALALASVLPDANSQSTTKALRTKTTPRTACQRCTTECSWSWPQPQLSSCSCWLKRDVTCIKLKNSFAENGEMVQPSSKRDKNPTKAITPYRNRNDIK